MKKVSSKYAGLSTLLIVPTVGVLSGCNDNGNETLVMPETNADGKYNILFLTVDQEAYMQTYPEGSDYAARERLRQIGTSFEKHYACSNVSTSSRSVIYTGRHITETGMLDNTNYVCQNDMDTDIKTVGDMMRQAGYYTAYKGKWHISEHYTSLEEYGFSDWTEGNMYGAPLEGYTEDATIAQNACNWLASKGKELNQSGKSFFLAVNFINPHDIMYFNEGRRGILQSTTAPDEELYQKQYNHPIPATWNEDIDSDERPNAHREYYDVWNIMTGHTPTNQADWKRFRDYYFNCIQDCDNQMLRVLDYLADNDLMKNTIIVFTSDHGEMMAEHGMKGKAGNIYENNIHVPLIIYHPEYEGGKSYSYVTSHLDLAPTFVDIATNNELDRKRIEEGIHGFSLLPVLDNQNIDVRGGIGALFVYDMLSMIDGNMRYDTEKGNFLVDMEKRGYLRGIITDNYKFARYFSPLHFNTPIDVEELYAHNDVEMYKMGSDETDNLAWPKGDNEYLVSQYSDKLNALIQREIGVDDGRETNNFNGGLAPYAK